MTQPSSGVAAAEPFSLVRNDVLFRLQRRAGLIPPQGNGILRRAVFYALLCWLPIMIWAWATGHMLPRDSVEPLLGHYSIHVRCLIAIPLLIVAEGVAQAVVPLCLTEFRRSGLVDDTTAPAFLTVLLGCARMRDRMFPWVVIAGLVLMWTLGISLSPVPDDMSWSGNAQYGFGGWWYLLVLRPVFSVLVLAWLWRLILMGIVLHRIARLPLRLVPGHPDHVGGLGFLDRLPLVFSPLAFVISAVIASAWAHGVRFHGLRIESLYIEMATLVVLLVVITLLPMLCFTPLLARTKKRALLDYGVLLARQGRLIDRRWIRHEAVEDDPILSAPELGPAADLQTLFEAVRSMRVVLGGKGAVLKVAVPALVPMVLLAAMQFPVGKVLMKLVMTAI